MEDNAMKKLMMIFALMSLALSLAASHPNPSELIISLHDGAAFNITIGDRSYNHQRTSYTISDLRPGRHFVRIVRYDRFFNGRVYVLGAPRVVFADYVRVPARSRIVGRIDHRGRFVEVERMALRYAPAPTPPAHYPPAYRPGSYPVAMSPHAFASLKATLANTRFESSRLDIAKHAVSRSNVSPKLLLARIASCSSAVSVRGSARMGSGGPIGDGPVPSPQAARRRAAPHAARRSMSMVFSQ
jgi:hypothetical protein